MGCRSRFWVDSIVGRGWLRQRCGFWSDSYLSLFVDGLVGLGFWVGDWLMQLMGGRGFRWICLGWGLAGICLGREGFGWDLMGCLGWGYDCLLWNLVGFAWVCFELCFWL